MRDMTKRAIAALLWFYAGWYAGAFIAELVGVTPLLGPVIGAAAAGLIAGDPRRIIWTARSTRQVAVSTGTEAVADPT